MLRCSKLIWKQTVGYGAIADAFRRKCLKMLENFVVAGRRTAADGIYSTNPRATGIGRTVMARPWLTC